MRVQYWPGSAVPLASAEQLGFERNLSLFLWRRVRSRRRGWGRRPGALARCTRCPRATSASGTSGASRVTAASTRRAAYRRTARGGAARR
jgi:hypothetical protein